MGRFFNVESLLVLLACLVVGVAFGFAVGLDALKAVGLGVVVALLAFLPAAAFAQDRLIELYASRGKLDRALDMAISIRESAPNTSMRNRASVDVALLQLLRREYSLALQQLEGVKMALVSSEKARAVVEGHIAYCLAHLNRDLDRAEELARKAATEVPKEPIFTYFIGLVLLQKEKAAEAEPLIAQSLEQNPDPQEPFPGERAWALARARTAQGKDPEPARAQAIAAGGHFAEAARALAPGGPS